MRIDRYSSGGRWEEPFGYSRAVAAGPFVLTAGCTSMVEGEVQHAGDPYAQTIEAFGVALRAIEQAGCTADDVIQTRMYVAHMHDSAEVGRAHGDLFRDVRPAATMVQIGAFIDPGMLVEVEVVAFRHGRSS